MITTVTLNPMLDKTVTVDGIRHGAIARASHVDMVVGGKGINVSRQLHVLGEETVATGFLGGEIGSLCDRLLHQEGLRAEFVHVAGMTREGVTYREAGGTLTAVFEPPHVVTVEEVAHLLETCHRLIAGSTWVVCSGSSPCLAADEVFRTIITACRTRGVPVVLDSYGNALALGMQAIPDIMKPNKEEFEQTFGWSLATEEEMAQAAREMVAQGVMLCIITDGRRPFVAADARDAWIVTPPEVVTINQTGSGDCMIAGILYALQQDWPLA